MSVAVLATIVASKYSIIQYGFSHLVASLGGLFPFNSRVTRTRSNSRVNSAQSITVRTKHYLDSFSCSALAPHVFNIRIVIFGIFMFAIFITHLVAQSEQSLQVNSVLGHRPHWGPNELTCSLQIIQYTLAGIELSNSCRRIAKYCQFISWLSLSLLI